MKTRKTLTAGAVICSLIGVLIGAIIKSMPAFLTLSDIISAFFVLFGIFTLVSSIPDLFFSFVCFGTFKSIVDFISAAIGIASGLILIFWHEDFLVYIISAYLIAFPIIRIFLAHTRDERISRLKRLCPKIILGTLLVIFFPFVSTLANEAFSIVLLCIGWGFIALSAIFLLVSLIYLYVRPIFSKKPRENNHTIYLDEDDINEK